MSPLVYHDGLFYREDDYLAHYGVKGMKWGVRKARDIGSTARAVGTVLNRRRSSIYKKALQNRIDRHNRRVKYGKQVATRGALLAGTAIAARHVINKRNVKQLHTNRDKRYSKDERNNDLLKNKPLFYSGEKYAAKVNANVKRGMDIDTARQKARESVRNGRIIKGVGAASAAAALYTPSRARMANEIVNRASNAAGRAAARGINKSGPALRRGTKVVGQAMRSHDSLMYGKRKKRI